MAEPIPDPDDIASAERAVANARAALGLAASEPARAWSVARIDPAAPAFFLVVFGAPQAAVGIAAVDRSSGEILEKARLPGRQPHLLIGAEEAVRRAGMEPGTDAALLWDPVSASRSPFYPLWRLRDVRRTLWVDSVRGTVWKISAAPRGGGAVPD